jgi:hypothetical protein
MHRARPRNNAGAIKPSRVTRDDATGPLIYSTPLQQMMLKGAPRSTAPQHDLRFSRLGGRL